LQVDSGEVVEGNIVTNAVSSGYFRAMGTEFIAGRDFTAAEREGTEDVAIVNEEFAKRSGLGPGVVGRKADAGMNMVYTIIGVVRTIWLGGPALGPTVQLYVPLEQHPPGFVTFVAQVRGKTAEYLPVCRSVLQHVNPQIPVSDLKTLDQRLRETLAKPRFYATAVLFLGCFALLLAVMGIYGVATYSVIQRTHEIGVRIAVGASPTRLRTHLIRQSMIPVIVGMTAGVAGAMGSGRYLQTLIWSAEPVGTRTCVIAALVLSATAWMALWFATSRVIRLDPMVTLKSE